MADELGGEELERTLLDAIADVFEGRRRALSVTPGTAVPPPVPLSNLALQLATVVLFLKVVRADHEQKSDEHQALLGALDRVLGLRGDDAAMLVRVAEERLSRAPMGDLLNAVEANADPGQRKQIVENLWRLAFADAELAGNEEYFVRKVALAVGLSLADLMETKVKAREAFLREDL